MSISEKNANGQQWIVHYVVDPYVVMLSLGALGHMRHIPLLLSFSYLQVFLVNVVIQHITPLILIRDWAKIPSSKKVKI